MARARLQRDSWTEMLIRRSGGAERLVVDAAVSLQNRGHDVTIFTSRHDPKRCFEETRDGAPSSAELRTL